MTEVPQAERELLAGAERRLGSLILGLIPIGTAVMAWRGGGGVAIAFAVGGALAYLNYRWIVAIVDTLLQAQQVRVPGRTYLKLFLPLLLLGVLLYVMFSQAWLSVTGVLSGLLLLVAAVLLEAVYELFLAVRR